MKCLIIVPKEVSPGEKAKLKELVSGQETPELDCCLAYNVSDMKRLEEMIKEHDIILSYLPVYNKPVGFYLKLNVGKDEFRGELRIEPDPEKEIEQSVLCQG